MKVKIKVNVSGVNAELNASVQNLSPDFSKVSPQGANFCKEDDRKTKGYTSVREITPEHCRSLRAAASSTILPTLLTKNLFDLGSNSCG